MFRLCPRSKQHRDETDMFLHLEHVWGVDLDPEYMFISTSVTRGKSRREGQGKPPHPL